MLDIALISIAVLALLCVMFEDIIHIDKAKTTLLLGSLSWLLLFMFSHSPSQTEHINQSLMDNLTEISTLWLFLVAAMTFVAYLNRKGLIESVMNLVMPRQISLKALLFFTAIFSFCFSSLADNITATLVSIALVLSLSLPLNQTIRFAVLVVFAVNSGGVSLITGDVTTLMIFLQHKVSITELLMLIIPSFFTVLVLATLLSFGLKGEVKIKKQNRDIATVDYVIAGIFLCTIIFTLAVNVLFSIPPVLSFLTGMAVMFMVATLYGEHDDNDPILDYIRYIEFDTLLFFLGVLLLVGMLEHIHALNAFLYLYDALPIKFANYLMGIVSSMIDNVPLTAALLKAEIAMSTPEWLSFTYAVGVGGSLLVIGSAAGIVAMSKVEGLTFTSFLRYSALLLFAYSFGYTMVLLMSHYLYG